MAIKFESGLSIGFHSGKYDLNLITENFTKSFVNLGHIKVATKENKLCSEIMQNSNSLT